MPTPSAEVAGYIDSLPEPRRHAIGVVRDVVLAHLPYGYEESVEFGMLSYQVPLSVYPETYNKRPLMYVALASQKSHMALYLCGPPGSEKLRRELEVGFKKAGKKLDMGKSCVRFKALEDLPFDVIGKVIATVPMKTYVALDRSLHAQKTGATADRGATRSKKKTSTASKSNRRSTPSG